MEASTERVLDHLRGPLPGRGDLLTEDAGNTVSEIDPARAASMRQTSQVLGLSSGGCCVVCPGGLLVVAGVGLQAAVEDADEAVGELAERSLVADVPSA
jgi:hypothetical protein